MGDLGAGKERGRSVGAGGDTGSAADAGGGIHRLVGDLLADEDVVGVRRLAGGDGDVAARFDDVVEGAAVDDEVLDDGEGLGAPRLQSEFVAILEVAHGELARGGGALRAVGDAVDHEAAGCRRCLRGSHARRRRAPRPCRISDSFSTSRHSRIDISGSTSSTG